MEKRSEGVKKGYKVVRQKGGRREEGEKKKARPRKEEINK